MVTRDKDKGTTKAQRKLLDSLSKSTGKSGSDLDTFITQVLSDHLDWHAWATEAGFIQTHKTILKNLFDNIDETTIRRQADVLAHEIRAISFMNSGSNDLEACLDVFKKIISKSGFQNVTFGNRNFVFQHNMGHKCSMFYGVSLERLIESMQGRSKIDYTRDVLSIQIL